MTTHSPQVDLSKKHGMEYLLVEGGGARLPPHPRVVRYLGHFTDTASKTSLPSYNVDPECVD